MPDPVNFRYRISQLLVLSLAAVALYGPFLSSPPVFDDHGFFDAAHPEYLQTVFGFELRWLPYATFEWTRALVGDDMIWLRSGNLALHVASGFLLFLFLRRLFEIVVLAEGTAATHSSHRDRLSLSWLAFSGAILFVLHPAAVYGVAYLIQRTILMATLFALLAWSLFLEGLIRNKQRWLLASAAAYLLSALSKEHAIMVPAVSFALFFLVRKPDWPSLARAMPIFLLYGLVGAFIVFRIKSGNVLGNAYEPNGAVMLAALTIDAEEVYPLSILTQCYLYFKYLFLWLVPDTSLMSVDMREDLAAGFWVWPETAGLAAFVLYPVVAGYLLFNRGKTGLLGFAMLGPWLLFATELSTVRIQESFVIYRSYLWMPCIAAGFPFVFQKLPARHAIAILATVTLVFIPLAWNRLTTFSDPVLLWSDALRLAMSSKNKAGVGRIYHNRGVAYLNKKHYQEAIRDFDVGIALLPKHSLIYNDRAVAYLETGRYLEALNDFDTAIWFDPGYYNPYLGRAQVFEALGNPDAARRDYARSCELGVREVCNK